MFEMNSFSMLLFMNHASPTVSSPLGRRSTLGSFWSRPSCSLVIFTCGGRRRAVIPVPHKQSQLSSWMSSFSSNLFRLRHSLKATARIFLSEGGAAKDSRPEFQNALCRISLTVESGSKVIYLRLLQPANALSLITGCCSLFD